MRSRLPEGCETAADLLDKLGGIHPRRVRLDPPLGTATERDLLRVLARTGRLYELVDGTLVEKAMGFLESFLALDLASFLQSFVKQHDLGILVGEAGTIRLLAGLVRMPDVAFISWQQLPERKVPSEPIPELAPELAVAIRSEGNSAGEMDRKLKEYFLAGVRLVWFVDPRARIVMVFTAPEQVRILDENQTLDGGEVLPGFTLPLAELFARLPEKPAKPSKGRTKKARKPKKSS